MFIRAIYAFPSHRATARDYYDFKLILLPILCSQRRAEYEKSGIDHSGSATPAAVSPRYIPTGI